MSKVKLLHYMVNLLMKLLISPLTWDGSSGRVLVDIYGRIFDTNIDILRIDIDLEM